MSDSTTKTTANEQDNEQNETIEYHVELTGNEHKHSTFREAMAERGATITAETDPDEITLPGVGYSVLPGGCPECDSNYFRAAEVSEHGIDFNVEPDGTAVDFSSQNPYEVRLTYVECGECEETLIENAEIVHDALSD